MPSETIKVAKIQAQTTENLQKASDELWEREPYPCCEQQLPGNFA